MTEPLLPILLATKKPVTVEAVHYTDEEMQQSIVDWINTLRPKNEAEERPAHIVGDGIRIPTLEGAMDAQFGDYIIRGIKGEFYPCKPDIFHATYDLPTGQVH